MTQGSLFDLNRGRQLRDEGIARVAANNDHWRQRALGVAVELARKNGQVTSDDVHAIIGDEPPGVNANTWGSLFRGKRWMHVGDTQSKRPAAHARTIKVWRLRY